MAKITTTFPQAPVQYNQGQFNELIRALDSIVLQLNNTFTNSIPEEEATAMSWFLGGGGGSGTIPASRLPKSIAADWESKSSAFDADGGKAYFVDTSGGAVTATLPASPSAGDTVRFADVGFTFDTNNLTVGRNGNYIQAVNADLVVATEGAAFALVYSGSSDPGWILKEK